MNQYPNVSISDYGEVTGAAAMMKEIYHRGSIACYIASDPILNYVGGLFADERFYDIDHVVTVVGWGTDSKIGKYWRIRNSWGDYWGEYGYIRVKFESLSITNQGCAWATVKDYTAPEKNNYFSCHEGGDNCKHQVMFM